MASYSNDWVGLTLSGGRYRVDAKLGEGGMGFVYKVWDRNLDTYVVIKVPRRSMLEDVEFASRFAREIRSLVKLSHPNIVKVSDVGEHDDLPFAVMQYLPGGSLDERQATGRQGRPAPAPPGSLASWLPGVAAALDYIHREKYIHRDVKPANILFDAQGHPFLGDFGVAKVLGAVELTAKRGATVTGAGIVLGTPEYMAPELIMGDPFDGRVDQYALAATAYEMLCGRKPFSGDTPTAILVRQTSQEPPPLVELRVAGSEGISRVILKGLAKDPARRFASCGAFACALVEAAAETGARQPAVTASRPLGRLTCPKCGQGFPVPASVLADPARAAGKRTACTACRASLRFSEDGLGLVSSDASPRASSGTVVVTPEGRIAASSSSSRIDRTIQLGAIARTPTFFTARPDRSEPVALPPTQVDRPARRRVAVPLAIGGAAVATLVILGIALAFSANRGTILIRVEPIPAGATVALDGQPVSFERLQNPLKLPVGPHRLDVDGPGFEPYRTILAIEKGSNPAAEVHLKPKAPSVAAPIGPAPIDRAIAINAQPKTTEARPDLAIATRPAPAPLAPPDAGPALPISPVIRPAGSTGPASTPKAEQTTEDDRSGDVAETRDPQVDGPDNGATLEKLAAEPGSFEGRVVIPSELLRVDTQLAYRQGPFEGLSVECPHYHFQRIRSADSLLDIVVPGPIGDQLRTLVRQGKLVPGTYPAIVNLRIVKDRGRSNAYLGIVERLEFLLHISPSQIALRRYTKAFQAMIVTPEGSQVALGQGELWRRRLGQNYMNHVRLDYIAAKRQQREHVFDQMEKQVATNAAAISAQLQRQQAEMIRKAWSLK